MDAICLMFFLTPYSILPAGLTCGFKNLSLWPLSPVNDIVKKSLSLMSSKPLKIIRKTYYVSPQSSRLQCLLYVYVYGCMFLMLLFFYDE